MGSSPRARPGMGFEREIHLERNLTIGEPRFLGAAAVVPLTAPEQEAGAGARELTYEQRKPVSVAAGEERSTYGAGMRRDEEVEAVGMEIAMQYERERHPELSPDELAWRVTRRMQGDPTLGR